jgi:hypothetical protein
VKQKRDQLKKDIEERNSKATYKPKITANFSRRKESTESSVFDRLYALSEKEKTEGAEPMGTFHPTINARSRNLVREGPVDQMLYGDALRRQ